MFYNLSNAALENIMRNDYDTWRKTIKIKKRIQLHAGTTCRHTRSFPSVHQQVGSDIAYPETEKLIELGKLFECSMDYLLKDEVTERTGASIPETTFTEKVTEISKKVMTDKNKGKAKKILKIIGIILAAFLVVDIISMILYFCVLGTPH